MRSVQECEVRSDLVYSDQLGVLSGDQEDVVLHPAHHVEGGHSPGRGHSLRRDGGARAGESSGEEVRPGPDHAGQGGLQVHQHQLAVRREVHQEADVGPQPRTQQHHVPGLRLQLSQELRDGSVTVAGQAGEAVARVGCGDTLEDGEACRHPAPHCGHLQTSQAGPRYEDQDPLYNNRTCHHPRLSHQITCSLSRPEDRPAELSVVVVTVAGHS